MSAVPQEVVDALKPSLQAAEERSDLVWKVDHRTDEDRDAAAFNSATDVPWLIEEVKRLRGVLRAARFWQDGFPYTHVSGDRWIYWGEGELLDALNRTADLRGEG